ncbi:hypothetical protein F183_A11590 [Bryobacterales bacterium F-183]|nr:hypothetical protein F183_A11590 [Bryobacterales bacterium F-183]
MAEAWRDTELQDPAAAAEQHNPSTSDLLSWAPAGSPMFVDYTADAMKQVRDHVIVGFHRLAKRGIECGGVLYGKREGRKVTVTQIREIICEYKTGPSFVLSERDKSFLADLLKNPPEELASLTPVGFYISHTKDDIYATDRDMAIYDTFFPQVWQVMLILRPARQGALRAGFFVRGQLGEFRGDHSFEEFDIDGPETPAETAALMAAARGINEPPHQQQQQVPAPRPRAAAAAASSSGASNIADSLFLPSNPISALPVEQMPVRALDRNWGGGNAVAPSRSTTTSPAPYAGSGLATRGFQYSGVESRPYYPPPAAMAPARSRQWLWFAAWCASLLVVGIGAYWFITVRQAAPLLLRLAEQDGDLRIEWDRSAPSVRNAALGSLEIRDGSRTKVVRLTPDQLAIGSYLYPLSAGDVSVRMNVNGTWSAAVEESASFVAEALPGSSSGKADAELRQHRDKLLLENRKLKNDTKKLEDRLEALERKLNAVAAADEPAPAPKRANRGR